MSKRTRMSKEARRQQILDSALKTFIDKGYNGATTLDIAKEANIAEVTLFRYFESKEEMFKLAIEPLIMENFKETIEVSSSLNPYDKFKYVLKERVKFINEHHDVIKLVLMESKFNPEIADYDFIKKITHLIESSIEDSNLEIKDVPYFIRLVRGMMLSFLYDTETSEEMIDLHISRFINMLIVSGVIEEKEGKRE